MDESEGGPGSVGRAGAASAARGVPALLSTAHLFNDAYTSILPALLPVLGLRFGLGGGALGLLVALFSLSSSLPQPVFGTLADRVGRHRVAAAGLATSAGFLSGLAFAPDVPTLAVMLLAGGLGSAALHPAGLGLARAAAGDRGAFAIAVYAAGGMVGGALGPLAVLAIVPRGGALLAWAVVPGLLVALAVHARGAGVGAPAVPAAPVTAARRALPVAASRRTPWFDVSLLRGPVGALALVEFLAMLAYLSFANGAPLWIAEEQGLGASSPAIGRTLAAFAGAAAVGGLAAGALARRVGRVPVIVGSLAAAAVLLELVLRQAPGSWTYYATVAAAGAAIYAHTPLLILRAQELAPGAESAASGVILGVTSAAAGLLYPVVGLAQGAFGVGTTLAIVSLALVAAAVLAARVLASPALDAAPAPVRAPAAPRALPGIPLDASGLCQCAAAA